MDVVLTVTGIALVGFACFVGALVWAARKAAKKIGGRGPQFEAPPYRHLSADANCSVEDIEQVLEPYRHAEGVGQRAERALAQLRDAQRKCEALQSTASARFTKSSMSLDAVTDIITRADEAYNKVYRNCITLANSIQTFDVRDYHALKRQRLTSTWKQGGGQDTYQQQRLDMMESRLSEIDAGLQANESLLLELDQLTANLTWLERAGTRPASSVSAVDEELRGYASRSQR